MSDLVMGEFARRDVRAVLRERFGIESARRVRDTDPTEEIVMLSATEFAKVDPTEVALALMEVLPDKKVWVIEESPVWLSLGEPL